ncbi:hypothetical protein Acr_05g0015160 [Actinidia rufa]|uniref:Uncharacterized protein n=1 Tax=Actinidia rufa TaxID=165716 RepID=A0A7J0EQL8_9ERIC|nr:hypothetical protein Acr_05g0015160 [Actinidia rufa]
MQTNQGILHFRKISRHSLSVLRSTLGSSSLIFCYANKSRDSSVLANFTPLSLFCDQRSVAHPGSSVMRTNQGILRFRQISCRSLSVLQSTLCSSSQIFCYANKSRDSSVPENFTRLSVGLRSTLSSSSRIFCYANKSRDSSVSGKFHAPLSLFCDQRSVALPEYSAIRTNQGFVRVFV